MFAWIATWFRLLEHRRWSDTNSRTGERSTWSVRELVSLQRRCSNNLNQVAIQANTYGGIYPEEIKALQRDYETLWEPLSDLLKKLSAVVEL